jgi:uncharacterized protein
MTAPLFSDGSSLALTSALAIGFGFGWFLERGGLGSARKLAGQFHLTDLTVFRVMFSALITAMLGAFWLACVGMLDLSRVNLPETFLLPAAVGGAIFGAGFVIGGLCPGTSCVSAATGRIDGIAVIAGMLIGVIAFNLLYESVATFYLSTPRGSSTLPDILHHSYGAVIALVTGVALAGFALSRRIERQA